MNAPLLRGWPLATAVALVLVASTPARAGHDSPAAEAGTGEIPTSLAGAFAVSAGEVPWALGDFRLRDPGPGWVAQATGAPRPELTEPKPEEQGDSSELNRQLSNPVTSLWSLTFQFNNYQLANNRWNYNLQFQPVLPIGLTRDWNLITRPVIPLYNSVPFTTSSGQERRSTGFGDMILLELLSPANSGNWILGAGPTFIFPTATSTFTGQGKWQAGPGVVVGYLTKEFIVGVFPQQWWSFAGDSDRPATSQLNLQPFGAYFFGDGWNVGYSGNILADWKARSYQGRLDRAHWLGSRQGAEAGAPPRQAPARAAVHAHSPPGHRPAVECAVPGHPRHPQADQGAPLRLTAAWLEPGRSTGKELGVAEPRGRARDARLADPDRLGPGALARVMALAAPGQRDGEPGAAAIAPESPLMGRCRAG